MGTEKSTVTLSIRIPLELKTRMKEKAKILGVTLNALATMELYRLVEWGRLSEEFDSITISKKILAALVEYASEDDVKKIGGNLLSERLKDQTNRLFGTADTKDLLKLLQLTAKYLQAPPASYSEFNDKDGLHFLVRHGVSKKWSTLLGEAFVIYLKAAKEEATYDARENSISVTVKQGSLRR